MPLVYQQNINETTKLGLWHITEDESFFNNIVLQRSINHPHKRLQHLAGRKLLIELEQNFPLHKIEISKAKKPFLPDDEHRFSISHCGDYAAVIVSENYGVGIDVETITPKINNLLHKFLTTAEQALIMGGGLTKFATLFWSVKETIYKWHGHGGLDFKKDMRIQSFEINDNKGVVYCLFEGKTLLLNFVCIENNFVAWLVAHYSS